MLIESTDDDFAWMLGEASGRPGLRLPPGGLAVPPILKVIRAMQARVRAAHGHGGWMMVLDGEVVGTCGYKAAPAASGEVEIGYGVAPERQRLGHATSAVAAMIAAAHTDPPVRALTAETALENLASQRVLIANGFVPMEKEAAKAGMIWWRLDLEARPSS